MVAAGMRTCKNDPLNDLQMYRLQQPFVKLQNNIQDNKKVVENNNLQ